jgi:hypothetical protein
MRIVNDPGFALAGWPAYCQYIEPGGATQQAMMLEELKTELRQLPLLGGINRQGRAVDLGFLSRANLDEDDDRPINRHQVQFAERAGVIPRHDPIA